MPCHARLDAPGILHHVMVRGIEGRVIFRDKVDRAAFVAALRHTLPPAPGDRGAAPTVAAIIQRVCTSLGMDPMRLQRGGHKTAVSQAREGIAYLGTEVAGHLGRALSPLLGVRPVSVYAAARRGLAKRGRWDALMDHV